MESAETVGAHIKRLRRERGLSQADVSSERVTASYVSRIEAGDRIPTAASLDAIAARLGTTRAYLETGVDENSDEAAQLELNYADLVLRNGDAHVARDRFLSILTTTDKDKQRRAWRAALWGLARATEALNDLDAAVGHLLKLLESTVPSDVAPTRVRIGISLARCYRESGDLTSAVSTAEIVLSALDGLGDPGDPDELALSALLVSCYYEAGNWLRASRLSASVIERADATGDTYARGAAYWNASLIAQGRGELGLALEYSERALALYADGEQTRNLAMVRVHHAWILLQQDDANAASVIASLEPLAARLENDGDDLPLAYCRLEMARAHLFAGSASEGELLSGLAADTFKQAKNDEQYAHALLVRAQALQQLSQYSAAFDALKNAVTLVEALPPSRPLASLWLSLAKEFARIGEHQLAVAAYEQAAGAVGLATPPQPPAVRPEASAAPPSTPTASRLS